MSARCTNAVFERYPAGGGEFALALALADNAHEDGTHIFPRVETMARKSRQDVRSVQRHLKRMQAIGWLLRVSAGGGRGRATQYRISPRWLAGEELTDIAAGHAPEAHTQKGDKASPFSTSEKRNANPGNLSPISAPSSDAERVTNKAQKGDNHDTHYMNRKEPSVTPLTPHGGDAAFSTLARAYPAHRVNEHQARKRWRALNPDARLASLMVQAARAQARSPEWQANNGHAVPNLSGWILNCKWRATHDERETPAAQTAVAKDAPSDAPQLSDEELQARRDRADQARKRAREITRRPTITEAAKP